MKKFIGLIILLVGSGSVFGQAGPVTLVEYRKMLYGLADKPDAKSDIVAALRKRGIDFVLTDGIRSLTRSKGANNDELKRALEEAERRRKNPEAAQLPSATELAALLDTTRKNTLDAVGEMPDFVVKQQIQRSAAYAGTGNFRNLDKLVVAVNYRSTGEESYRVLTINGAIQNQPEAKGSYEQVGGTSSTGEFVTMLSTIFKPESSTRFEAVDTDLINGRRAVIFEIEVEKDRARQWIGAVGYTTQSTISGIKGRVWIDRELGRVLRIDSEATDIPATFPVRSAKRVIDYDWVKIEDQRYLLPSLSDVRLTMRQRDKVFETRNLIRFREYQKYGSEVRILDDDIQPDPEPPQVDP